MAADMQNLESAARLAMGSFEGPSALPAKSERRMLARWLVVAVAVAALGLLAATIA